MSPAAVAAGVRLPTGLRSLEAYARTAVDRLRVYFSPLYTHALRERHPFPMERYEAVQTNLRERIVGTEKQRGRCDIQVVGPQRLASVEEAMLAHDSKFVQRYIQGNMSDKETRAIGFPWTPEFVTRTMCITAATIEAMLDVLVSGHPVACNAAGGTHHAMRDRGEGYCIFNDLAVCARLAQLLGLVDRVAIVDLDVHQGNGTAEIFADDPSVFTFSLHGEKNYPWKSRVLGDLDVGVEDTISPAAYLEKVDLGLQEVANRFLHTSPTGTARKDRVLVLYQAGVDALVTDRWGRLNMTRETLQQRNARVFEWCALHNLPIVTTMGGGYSKPIHHAAQAHADVFFQAMQFHSLRRGQRQEHHQATQ